MNRIIEKKHRLDKELYLGQKIVSFTCCIKNRDQVFVKKDLFDEFENILLKELSKFKCDSLIHLFMPDHVHLILRGKNESSDVIKTVDMFKQETGFWFYKNLNKIKWQKDYHDHIIRNDEDLKKHINYVLYNPIRAGICEHWKEYKFKGSTVYNFDDWE
ncbi:MAG: transposase [Ignavibacteria bacterium]